MVKKERLKVARGKGLKGLTDKQIREVVVGCFSLDKSPIFCKMADVQAVEYEFPLDDEANTSSRLILSNWEIRLLEEAATHALKK